MQIPLIVLADEGGRFISAIESQRGRISVVRHAQDMGEMLGVAHSGIARAVLVVGQSQDLTQSMVRKLQDLEIAVCQIQDPGLPCPLQGVRYISSLAETEEVLAAITQAVDQPLLLEDPPADSSTQQGSLAGQGQAARQQAGQDAEPSRPQGPVADPGQGQTSEDSLEESRGQTHPREGKLLALWGPQGSPGRSTLASHLAGAYAQAGFKTCLVDADTYGASLAPLLGLSSDYSSLAQLCHLADRGKLKDDQAQQLIHSIKHGPATLDVITGINRPDRWVEIRSDALSSLYHYLKKRYQIIIIDTSFCLEEDPTLAFDSLGPQRNEATLTSLRQADHIVCLGQADLIGVPRFITAFDQLRQVLNQPQEELALTLIFNRLRAEAIGPSPALALEHSWKRFGPNYPLALLLPEEAALLDAARLQGKTLLETAPQSPLAQAIGKLQTLTQEALGLSSDQKLAGQGAEKTESMIERKKGKKRFFWNH